MKDIVGQLRAWEEQGKRYALATLIKVDRSAPKGPGAAMAVTDDGAVAGSVSGGCVESAVCEEAARALESGVPKIVRYGISDDEGFEIGLACGGELHLFVDVPTLPAGLLESIEGSKPVALATVVSGPDAGHRTLLERGGTEQSATPSGLSQRISRDADGLLARGASELRNYPEGDVFIQTFGPPAEMYVFGAADFSAAVCKMGQFLGYHVSVIDPRAVFATKERFPDADEVVLDWPDRFLAKASIGPSTAIVILTHDAKFDVPALLQALQTDAGYIGAMGAKRTNERRFARLREAGCSEEQLARIHAPIGLDIGNRGPEETAISVAAEIIALRNGKTGL